MSDNTSLNFNLLNYGVMKMMRFATVFLSIQIASNYMSQIYTENVLVNDLDPPKLSNFIILFAIIDVIVNAIILMILFGFKGPLGLTNYDFMLYIAEYATTLVLLLSQLYIISSIMYSNKYFLYKDDGLRAIRALRAMCYRFAIIYYLIPFGYFTKEIIFNEN